MKGQSSQTEGSSAQVLSTRSVDLNLVGPFKAGKAEQSSRRVATAETGANSIVATRQDRLIT